MEEFACLALLVWNVRCRALHDGESRELKISSISAACLLEDHRKASREILITKLQHQLSSPRQQRGPPIDHLRLDVDASFQEYSVQCGIGGVFRNHEGRLVAAFGKILPTPGSVFLGELLAIKEGLKIVQEKGFKNVLISSDSLLAVQVIT